MYIIYVLHLIVRSKDAEIPTRKTTLATPQAKKHVALCGSFPFMERLNKVEKALLHLQQLTKLLI